MSNLFPMPYQIATSGFNFVLTNSASWHIIILCSTSNLNWIQHNNHIKQMICPTDALQQQYFIVAQRFGIFLIVAQLVGLIYPYQSEPSVDIALTTPSVECIARHRTGLIS